ncbi:MAG: transcription termination/antitermination NusG family protein [Candidatus Binatia bacterium]
MKDLRDLPGLTCERPIVTTLQNGDLPWYVVHTQPRREHLAEVNLRPYCPGLFCPRYRHRGILHGYVREIVRPLFPNYLFAAFDAGKDFRAVHYAHGVRGVVAFGGELAVVPPGLLASIESHMHNGCVVLAPPALEPGQRVEIVAGSFQGYTGIFQEGLKGADRVAILLDTLKYQARVVLDRAAVAPVVT